MYSIKTYKTANEVSVETIKEHKGFSIIKVSKISRDWSPILQAYLDNPKNTARMHITFCKVGDETKESKHFDYYGNDIAKAEQEIDDMLNNKVAHLTYGDYRKYVTKPNSKCGWGFSKRDLLGFLARHSQAKTERVRYIIEERLTDANFHTYCSLLSSKDYGGFLNQLNMDYTD